MTHIKPKRNIHLDYMMGDVIGEGRFGLIKRGVNIRTRAKVAIKIVDKRMKESSINGEHMIPVKSMVFREINAISICNHPHIVKYIDFYEDNYQYYIIMEYAEYGDLFDLVYKQGRLDIFTARKIFAQLLSCIEYCHGNLISHRDIKPENILITDINEPIIKLADFGLSARINIGSQDYIFCGTAEYSAPEILTGEKCNPMKTDIWSLGVVLYFMLFGSLPWGKDDRECFKNIIRYKYCRMGKLDECLDNLLSKIFCPAKRRISIRQIKEHPWMNGYAIPSFLPFRKPIRNINLSIINKIVSLGFTITDVLNSVLNNLNTPETAIYHTLNECQKMNDDIEVTDVNQMIINKMHIILSNGGRRTKSLE